MLRIRIHSDGNKIATAVTAGVTTTYSNDTAGNTTKATTSGVSIFYDYDAAGRMYAVDAASPVTFTYNADHQRILKVTSTASTGFLYDGRRGKGDWFPYCGRLALRLACRHAAKATQARRWRPVSHHQSPGGPPGAVCR